MTGSLVMKLSPGVTIMGGTMIYHDGVLRPKLRVRVKAPSRPVSWQRYVFLGQQWHPTDVIALERLREDGDIPVGTSAEELKKLVDRMRARFIRPRDPFLEARDRAQEFALRRIDRLRTERLERERYRSLFERLMGMLAGWQGRKADG